MSLCFFFNIKGDPDWEPGTLFYYNGDVNEVQPVHNLEEMKYVQATYEDAYNRQLVTYFWNNMAPVYVRFFGVVQPGTTGWNAKFLKEKIDRIRELSKVYVDIYGDPTGFIAHIRVPIRADCDKTSEILGWANINQYFDLDKTTTVCDYHWGRINYNGVKAWIAIGDITGEVYGEWTKNY